MGYSKDHTEDECDRCLKKVGKENLKRCPFVYKDMNDKMHPEIVFDKHDKGGHGYRQYFLCDKCYDEELGRI